MPRTGLSARRTERSAPMLTRPAMPRNRNHNVMTGPKNLPIDEVPAFWAKNSTLMIRTVIATTMAWLSPMSV